MDRGAWQATVHGIAELDTTEATSHTCMLGHEGVFMVGIAPFKRKRHKFF